MKSKRLAFFLPSLHGGGTEKVVLNLAKSFAGKGYTVDLLVAAATGEYLNQIPVGVNLIDLQAKRVFFSLPALIRYLRRYKPESLLSAMFHANIVAVWAVKLVKVPTRVVVSEHTTLSESVKRSRNLRDRLVPALAALAYRRADNIIAVSNGVADDLSTTLNLPRQAVQVIYNPVVDEELLAKAKAKLDHPWFKDGKVPVILSVGRLVKEKDYGTLIRAFEIVQKTRPSRLIILGEGDKRSELEQLVKELGLTKQVSMPGFVSNPYAYMSQARVFVLSSKSEALPTVLIEAMACGVPLVATDSRYGPREILANGRYGPLVEVGDFQGLAKAILDVLDTPTQQAGSNVLEKFSFEFAYRQYKTVLINNVSQKDWW